MTLERAKVVEKTYLNDDILECVVECHNEIIVHPGQYVLIKINEVWRSFSVAEVRDKTKLVFVIQLVVDTLSANFFRGLKIGSKLILDEPQGRMKLPKKGDIVFLATGTGLVPLYRLAEHLLAEGYTFNLKIIFGVQNKSKMFYQDKLDNLQKKHKNCEVVVAMSDADKSWTGVRGRVSDYIEDHIVELSTSQFYVCGRKETVTALFGQLANLGVPESKIHFIE